MILAGDWSPATHAVSVALELAQSSCLANLEGPLLPAHHGLHPHPKAGPSLSSCELPDCSDGLIVALANNHIMDYGLPGLQATLESLGHRGLQACGAGADVHDARRPIVVDDNGARVGIISCCEAQFGVATRSSAGVAEFGPWVYTAISDLRRAVDAVIVSVHAAVEDSPWPSPFVRELYHSYIEAGASVVHGHHAHVPQGYEAYGDGVIFYGMGNFAVDPDKWRDYPNGMWSLAAEVDLGSVPLRWRAFALEIRDDRVSQEIAIEESSGHEQDSHRRYLSLCNLPFDDPDMFEALWQEVALRAYNHYGAAYMGFSPAQSGGRRLRARAGMSLLKGALLNATAPTSLPTKPAYLLRHHMIVCESHRQMLATALGILAGELEDERTAESQRIADEMMPWSLGVVPR